METRWNHDQSTAVKRDRLCRNERMQRGAKRDKEGQRGTKRDKEGERGAMSLHVRKYPECMELCQRRDEETGQSSWVGIRGGSG